MSKQEQLMEYITQDVISFMVEDEKLDFTEAMHQFYTSTTYAKLLDNKTGLYLESSPYIYDIFKNEYNTGTLMQREY